MKLHYEDIENYCTELHALAKQMNETLSGVSKTGNIVLTSGCWEGNASEYYLKKLNNLTKNFDDVFKEIENSILYLAKSAEGYQAIDNTLMREICQNLNITEPNLGTSNIFR